MLIVLKFYEFQPTVALRACPGLQCDSLLACDIISVFFVFEAFVVTIMIWLRKDQGIDIAYSVLRSFECQTAYQFYVIFLNFWRQMQGRYLG